MSSEIMMRFGSADFRKECCFRLGVVFVIALFGVALAPAFSAEEPSKDQIELQNERPVTGPRVMLSTKFGTRYHPGVRFLLQGTVRIAGRSFEGGVTIREGHSEFGPRYTQIVRFDPSSPTRFQVPIFAPIGGADLTLSIWRDGGNGYRDEQFRASLAGHLKSVSKDQRVVWLVGAPWLPLQSDVRFQVATLSADELPERDADYQNVDLVVLNTEREPIRNEWVLQRWLNAGGRVAVISRHGLLEAIRCGLIPIVVEQLGSDFAWWAKHAGMKESDVVRDEKSQLVFGRFRLGFGSGLFFFPGVDSETRYKFADRALRDPSLEQNRPNRDERVSSRPYDSFTVGVIGTARKTRTVYWAGVGGFCLVALLAFASAIRVRYLAAGLSIGFVALLSAYLSKTFPAPEGVVSRITFMESKTRPGPHRITEWNYLEGFEDWSRLSVSSESETSLKPLFAQGHDMGDSGLILEDNGETARYSFSSEAPTFGLPIFEARKISDRARDETAGWQLQWSSSSGDSVQGTVQLGVERAMEYFGTRPRGACMVIAGVPVGFLRISSKDGVPSVFIGYEGAQRGLRTVFPEWHVELAQARGKALEAAIGRAVRSGDTHLILCDEYLSKENDLDEALAQIEGVRFEQGPWFRVWEAPMDVR